MLIDLLLDYNIKLPLYLILIYTSSYPWYADLVGDLDYLQQIQFAMRGMGKKINKDGIIIVAICCHCIVGVVFLFTKLGEKIIRKVVGNFYWKKPWRENFESYYCINPILRLAGTNIKLPWYWAIGSQMKVKTLIKILKNCNIKSWIPCLSSLWAS